MHIDYRHPCASFDLAKEDERIDPEGFIVQRIYGKEGQDEKEQGSGSSALFIKF